MVESRRSAVRTFYRQLPFFLWLVMIWMLLWGQFTVLAFVTGVGVAVITTTLFQLPPVEMSGRINLWYGLVFIVLFLGAVVKSSLQVAWQVWRFDRHPSSAIIGIKLDTDDDLIMTTVGVTASLIPGSLVASTDRKNRVLYLHFLGVNNLDEVEKQRAGVLRWEDRIVRAIGSSEQYAQLKERGRLAKEAR